ncbi:unnamed protein product [Paramecium pentaurelia]|uniref:Uncharacterized protein n=1 Tax=Paramecium pentaurelia TaxID=43138 RepID=A0A8S1WTX2_9CILI|nr:unnamed protein product [Paramecium pentaurelia]
MNSHSGTLTVFSFLVERNFGLFEIKSYESYSGEEQNKLISGHSLYFDNQHVQIKKTQLIILFQVIQFPNCYKLTKAPLQFSNHYKLTKAFLQTIRKAYYYRKANNGRPTNEFASERVNPILEDELFSQSPSGQRPLPQDTQSIQMKEQRSKVFFLDDNGQIFNEFLSINTSSS